MAALRFALMTLLFGAGPVAIARADTCPTATLALAGLPSEELVGSAGAGTRSVNLSGANYYFTDFGDSLRFRYAGGGGSARITVRGRYRLMGAAPGTSLSHLVSMHLTGQLYGYGGDPYCWLTRADVYLLKDSAPMAGASWNSQLAPPPGDGCLRNLGTTLSFTNSHPAGAEFELAQTIEIYLVEGLSESGQIWAGLDFGPLPPGAFMVRCDGDTTVQVVDVGASPSASLQIGAVWPNPTEGEFRAAISVPAGGPAFVRLLDVSGRIVDSRVWDAPAASRRELAFGRSLSPGNYFLQVRQGAVTTVRQVVVRH